jgi:hypothetical protein
MRRLGAAVLALAGTLASAPAAFGQGAGSWEGPWDWSAVLYPSGGNPCVPAIPSDYAGKEFSHAALIAVGPWQGKVLLWRSERHTTPPFIEQAWIFDPSFPTVLFRIEQDLQDDIFCCGQTVDDQGNIVAAGGGTALVDAAYRFVPGRLAPYATWNHQPPFQNCPRPSIPGNPWLLGGGSDPNQSLVGDMSLGRYYPILFCLQRAAFGSGNQAVPGSSCMALGGELPPSSSGGHQVGENEFWQALPPHPATQWSHTFQAKLDPLIYPAHEYPPPGGPNDEEYERKSIPGEPLPHPRLNNYPRVVQLASIGDFLRNILIANDVSEAVQHSLPGLTWILRLRYPGGSNGATTEQWRGRPQESAPGIPIDRNYGNLIVKHDKTSTGASDGRNRVIVMNGEQALSPFTIATEVQEFRPGSDPAGGGASPAAWITKTAGLIHPRVTACTVILPTGEILVEGGERFDPTNPPGFRTPALQAELYDPGDAGLPTGASSTLLALPNNAPGANHPYHRLYHHLAVLLPDGRVFIAGGNPEEYLPPAWPIAGFSGEIYRPYYLDATYAPYRPQILSPTPSAVGFGTGLQTFDVTVDYDPARPVRDFVLIRTAAITHHFDSSQVYIELVRQGSTINTATNEETHHVFLPKDDLGPAGYYMLFALREYSSAPLVRVPSRAHFLKLQ